MFGFNKKMHICISLNNQPCIARCFLTNLNPDGYNQGLRYYSTMVYLDRYNGRCNTLDDPSDKTFCSKQNRRCKFKCF